MAIQMERILRARTPILLCTRARRRYRFPSTTRPPGRPVPSDTEAQHELFELPQERHLGRPLHAETQMMSYGFDPFLSEGAVKPPVFLTSTFAFRSAEDGAEF